MNEVSDFDLGTMSLIGNITNLIPVIGKKAQISKDEVINIKAGVVERGRKNNVNYFEIDKALNVIYSFTNRGSIMMRGKPILF